MFANLTLIFWKVILWLQVLYLTVHASVYERQISQSVYVFTTPVISPKHVLGKYVLDRNIGALDSLKLSLTKETE